MNPLNRFNNNQVPQQKGGMNNPMQMLAEFKKFANGYNGNAEEEVMKMLSNGQINQQQLNQAINFAKQFQGFFGGK